MTKPAGAVSRERMHIFVIYGMVKEPDCDIYKTTGEIHPHMFFFLLFILVFMQQTASSCEGLFEES